MQLPEAEFILFPNAFNNIIMNFSHFPISKVYPCPEKKGTMKEEKKDFLRWYKRKMKKDNLKNKLSIIVCLKCYNTLIHLIFFLWCHFRRMIFCKAILKECFNLWHISMCPAFPYLKILASFSVQWELLNFLTLEVSKNPCDVLR